MTDPVVLLGTQSNGETLPVQVNELGQLVAEGLQGPEGPQGPPGVGELPPDPYEGALLGWLNNQLSWIGSPPIPIPEDVFGPITQVQDGILTVDGEIPPAVGAGVYLNQVNEQGEFYTEGWNTSQIWTSGTTTGTPFSGSWEGAFNGVEDAAGENAVATYNSSGDISLTLPYPVSGNVVVYASANAGSAPSQLGGNEVILTSSSGNTVVDCAQLATGNPLDSAHVVGNLGNLGKITLKQAALGTKLYFIKVDDLILVDSYFNMNFRVNQVVDQNIIGVPSAGPGFTVGKYLKVPEQKVAPWVLYGNDPGSFIDHLRRE